MEESPPAPAPPKAGAASKEAAVQERRRRLRVPTPVLVTVLVAALSVWVAPAFTRQWDDRKQARQLQAQVAEDIALSTARFIHRGDFAGASDRKWQAIESDWNLSGARIEARLRVYFSPELRSLWKDFDAAVDEVEFLVRVVQTDPLEIRSLPRIGSGRSSCSELTPAGCRAVNREIIARSVDRVENLWRKVGDRPLPISSWYFSSPDIRAREIGAANLLLSVVLLADVIIDRLMTTDPDAYSTTRADLLRDLLP